MSISRSAIIDGPGSLTLGPLKLFSQENISAAVNIENWRPMISTHGEGGPRISDAIGSVTFTPSGRITADIIAALYPTGLRNPTIGAKLFGATDTALKVHAVDGNWVQFTAAAITQLADLTLSPKGTTIGEAALTCLIGNGLDRTAAGSFYTTGSAAWSETFADSDIIAVPYTGVWGSTTIHTSEGWKVSFEVSVDPIFVDGIGTVDYRVTGVKATATCQPVNLDASTLLGDLRPEQLAIGAAMRQTRNLVITGAAGGLVCTLYDAVLTSAPAQWGPSAFRSGELTLESSRQLTGEAPNTTMGAAFALAIAS